MGTITLPKEELRQIIKEAVSEVLIDNKGLLEDVVSEAIVDLGLGMAIEEGDTGEYVSRELILQKLNS